MAGGDDALAAQLRAGITQLQLTIDDERQASLLHYLRLLLKWNKTYNLTGIRSPRGMISLNLLDSLTVLPLVPERSVVLDVGTGAGLPGIPLAICRPEARFILLDSNGKKTRFMVQAAAALGLSNVDVVNCRAERFQTDQQIDIVVSRAFASLSQMLDWTAHLLPAHGRVLAMKGQYPEQEVAALPPAFRLAAAHRVAIPGEDCDRHILELARADAPHTGAGEPSDRTTSRTTRE